MDRKGHTVLGQQQLPKQANELLADWVALQDDLKILALSLCSDYDSAEARALLARDEISMLQTFFEKQNSLDLDSIDQGLAGHVISLAHGLLETAGGRRSVFWDQFDDRWSAFENQSICGLMVDVEGIDPPENTDIEQLYGAMLMSEIFTKHQPLRHDVFLEALEKCQVAISPLRRRAAVISTVLKDHELHHKSKKIL
ncbi:hypothetical protein FSARC_9119 [Fusarium sarcochroum]|uniref:Uncharacterized protein n=1 Tax=Fusarium sarcochroum TaxID=1208366 RepID=A0A8H4X6I9_9HYPO|nr:hypothetical protein FSARC_9119 [Fusarium sarcochroum]